jgi:hypothetical protein
MGVVRLWGDDDALVGVVKEVVEEFLDSVPASARASTSNAERAPGGWKHSFKIGLDCRSSLLYLFDNRCVRSLAESSPATVCMSFGDMDPTRMSG